MEPTSALHLPSRPFSEQIDLIFVRHGQSEQNMAYGAYHEGDSSLREKLCKVSTYCHRLTPKGVEQAEAVGAMLAKEFPSLHQIHTSDMVRALETALHIHKCLDQKHLRVVTDSKYSERSWGMAEWESGERGERHRDIHQERRFFRPTEWYPERGESGIAALKRARGNIRDLLEQQPKRSCTLIVSHGEMMWFMDAAIRRRSAVHVSHHDQVHAETAHNCGVWHYRIDTASDFRAVRRTTAKDPLSFGPWERAIPEEHSIQALWTYVHSHKRLIS